MQTSGHGARQLPVIRTSSGALLKYRQTLGEGGGAAGRNVMFFFVDITSDTDDVITLSRGRKLGVSFSGDKRGEVSRMSLC